uniref:Ribosomal N-lysine methyltransferase 3 n=1 Tax=Anthurium amnicola TaxID=1678845 RepID=A0A1D1Y9Z8_9ARAE
MCEDWKECVVPLIQATDLKLDPCNFGVDQYFSAKSLVASRSFEIDGYHGFGMVPLADLLNHKTGFENVHFTFVSSSTSDDDSQHDDAFGGERQSTSDVDPSSSGDDPANLEMIVVRDVEAGDEVFNTYGSMGNAALLHRYGFTEPDNLFDIVNIDLNLVLQWCTSSFSCRYTRARLSLWRQLNYSGCTSQKTEYFEITSDGEPQFELIVLLYIMFLPEEAYQKLNYTMDHFRDTDDTTKIIMLNTSRRKREPENEKEFFLTGSVCGALVALADIRDSLYGPDSLEDDFDRLKRCCYLKERKLHHSLVLRVSERTILGRLRAYASSRCKMEK